MSPNESVGGGDAANWGLEKVPGDGVGPPTRGFSVSDKASINVRLYLRLHHTTAPRDPARPLFHRRDLKLTLDIDRLDFCSLSTGTAV